jgi:hypothetical protein
LKKTWRHAIRLTVVALTASAGLLVMSQPAGASEAECWITIGSNFTGLTQVCLPPPPGWP